MSSQLGKLPIIDANSKYSNPKVEMHHVLHMIMNVQFRFWLLSLSGADAPRYMKA